jgi:small basic protein
MTDPTDIAANPRPSTPDPQPQGGQFGLWIPVLFLLVGFLIGLQLDLSVPPDFADYTAVGILAALDSVVGAIKAELSGTYRNRIFIAGFLSNTLLAAGLTFLGERLGVDLFLAAVVAFGVRLFNNVAQIRRRFL